MTAPRTADSRLRAYAQFLAAILFYFFARLVARHGAMGIANDAWEPLVEQAMLAFLLLFGFAGVGFSLNRQADPISAQGLPRRQGWSSEIGLGLAIGWSAALLCVIALAIGGGIAIGLSFSLSSWGWLVLDLAYFALLTLAEEIAFRGYPFQRFARAVGAAGAVFGFAAFYAFLQAMQIGSTRASIAVSFLLSVVLSTAYLRTRALWVSWGLNFGWKASRALLFGLTVAGNSAHSPVVQGDAMGSFWLTGGGYGLDGSWFAFFVLLAALPVVYRLTRDLDFRYNAPHLPPAGIPVDLDAAARRQHEAAMGAAPLPPTLVQIAPSTPPPPSTPAEPPPGTGNETH
ncbi:MAG: type II CAAX prenyl endopeptidase Rce1 family protein [Acidobacteriota bacterium]